MSDYTDIQPELDDFKNAVYGEEVRDSMISAIKKIYDIAKAGGDAPSGDSVPTEVRQAIFNLLDNNAFANDDTYTSDLAVLEAWASVATAITVSPSTASISGSSTRQLTAVTTPAGASVSWASSNTSVATVSSSGLVTGVGNGTCTITATSGSVSATCAVTVSGFATLTGISAVYTQSGTVYDTDTLDSLKSDLVVTANYSDSTTQTVTDYTLSGTLTEGTSTITVAYGGKTTTFNVTVSTDTAEYVTENMTVWLDGLRNSDNGTHVSNLSTWVDQSGNGNSFTNYGASVGNNHLVFDGSAYLTAVDGNTMTESGVYPTTAEIVFEVDDTTTTQAVMTGRGGNHRYNYSVKSGAFIFDYSNSDKSITIENGIHTYSTDGTNVYLDGEAVTSAGVAVGWVSSSTMTIGKYGYSSSSYPFSGKIYCIREYTSALTAEQIASNSAIDRRRFG